MLILTTLAIILLRLPSLWTPILDVDEAIFANFANRLLDGGIPYVDMTDNKPMGIIYFYAAVFKFFGAGNMIAVHALAILIVALTCYFIYKISVHLLQDEEGQKVYGMLSALTYAVFTTTYIPKMIATEIEIVMMLPITISTWLYLLGEKDNKASLFFLSGLLSGLAVIFKYQAGIHLIVIFLYWLLQRRKWNEIFFFGTGYPIAFLAMLIHLYFAGGLEGFYIWTLSESAAYIVAGFGAIHILRLFLIKGLTCMAGMLIVLIAAFWMVPKYFSDNDRRWRLIVIWFAATWIAVVIGGRFYGHYFIQLLPSAAIIGSEKIYELYHKNKALRNIVLFLFIGPAIGFSVPRYFTDPIYKAVGEDNPNDYKPIAKYIAERTHKDDFIYAWGFSPCINFFSDRRSASRFPFSNPLVGHTSELDNPPENPLDTSSFVHPLAWGMLWEDFAKHQPVYIVDTAAAGFHKYGAYQIERFAEFDSYLKKNYVYETTINGAKLYRRVN